MSTQSEIIHAQQGAYDFSGTEGRKEWWRRHLIGPVALKRLYEDAALLDRIRAHFQHGADESLWPPGTPLDEAVGRLVADAKRGREVREEEEYQARRRANEIERLNQPENA